MLQRIASFGSYTRCSVHLSERRICTRTSAREDVKDVSTFLRKSGKYIGTWRSVSPLALPPGDAANAKEIRSFLLC